MASERSVRPRAAAGMIVPTQPAPAPAAGAGAGLSQEVALDGVEIVQVVQNLDQAVLLVANKPTLVRVYLRPTGAAAVTIRGTLRARRVGTSFWTPISASADVTLNPALSTPAGLRTKRESLALSLNFTLPSSLLAAGKVEVELQDLSTVSPVASIAVPTGTNRQVTLRPAVPLRVHIVGIRYTVTTAAGTETIEPAALDYALTRSWLGRAYPVAEVIWSETVVDWTGATWPTDELSLGTWAGTVNTFLAPLRAQDVEGGTDHRTHYYGLAADGGGRFFMRGLAADVPGSPDPAVVASGPAGRPGAGFWDVDGSYADWYTGHELGHTFGRNHPGFCGESTSDPHYPHTLLPNGQISNDAGEFVGYDRGDPNRGIPAAALPGAKWHDVMTYCKFQWLSAYTYKGIYDRLVAESTLPAPGAPAPGGGAPSPAAPAAVAGGGGVMQNAIHIVAQINQTKGSGVIRYVTPISSAAAAQSQLPLATPSDYRIRLRLQGGARVEHNARFRQDACTDQNSDVTGSVDIIVPADPLAVAVELMYKDQVLDTYTPAGDLPEPQNVRPAAVAAGPTLLGAAPTTARPKIVWNATAPAAGPALLGAVTAGKPITYTVQVSNNDGKSWRTIGIGLQSPEVTVDPQLLVDVAQVQVRVTATNGLKAKTTTKTLDVKDL